MPKLLNDYFKVDPWKVIEEGFDPAMGKAAESVFTLANEKMAVRGYFDEGYGGDGSAGSYLNGVYYKNTLAPFWCKGLASTECFILSCVDWLYTRFSVDGEDLDLAQSAFRDFVRILDMKTGVLSREFVWELSGGRLLKLSFTRLTSMAQANIGCQKITLEPLNFDGVAEIRSGLDISKDNGQWVCVNKSSEGGVYAIHALAENSDQQVYSACRLKSPAEMKAIESDGLTAGADFTLQLKKGKPVSIEKCALNYAEINREVDPNEVWEKGAGLAKALQGQSFDALMKAQAEYWADVWDKLDIRVGGTPEFQQDARFSVFNMHQAYRGASEQAAGVISEAGKGRSWWNTEAYALPFYILNYPDAARKLLEFRYSQLPQALERAIEVGCSGACYPLATIDGTESNTWWEHSLLQTHISAVIAYAIWHYVNITGEKQFLYSKGVEMLLHICRYYASRGRWGQATGKFGLYGVMGADEFSMMVHNNFYTNMLVKKAFEFTLDVVAEMREEAPEMLEAAIGRVNLDDLEPAGWQKMADNMKVPATSQAGVFEQHDGFFSLPHIDVKSIPRDHLPVEDHWAYDRIYRYDMLRQPDVLLYMYMHNRDFTPDTKRVNYEYYESRCSHESPLSPCIHSILAAELGDFVKAREYARYEYNLKLEEGIPIPVMAANWLTLIYGYGGLRTDGEVLEFCPSLIASVSSYAFSVEWRGVRLDVEIGDGAASFKTRGGSMPIKVYGVDYNVDAAGFAIELPEERVG